MPPQAQAYAPEAKKTSIASLMELQKKLTESNRTAQVYKTFKAQFPRLVENQKAVADVTEKLAGHEAPITKAADVAKATKLTKEQVQQLCEKHCQDSTLLSFPGFQAFYLDMVCIP